MPQDVKEQTPVSTASGLTYVDKRIGGGAPVTNGFLIVLDYRQSSTVLCFLTPIRLCSKIAEVLLTSSRQVYACGG